MGHALHAAEKSPSQSPGRTSSHAPMIMRQPMGGSQDILQPKADRCACGGSCPRCREQSPIQKKLAISEPGDAYEQEADRVADEVLAAPAHSAVNPASPRIQRFTGQATGQAEAAPPTVDKVLASPGRPLEPVLRHDMEQRFGHDFSRVRVHSGAGAEQSARDVNAHAYTVGQDIIFAATRFAPATHAGRWLLAHELTHTIQQASNPSASCLQRAWNPCATADTCPDREPGELAGARAATLSAIPMEAPVRGILVNPFGIGSSDATALANDPTWLGVRQTVETGTDRWDILGFSDCEGAVDQNHDLRTARAEAVLKQLSAAGQARISNARAAPTSDCVSDEMSKDDRSLNRSAVMVQIVGPVTALTCPPATPIVAADVSMYVSLVLCVEHLFPAYSPRQILSLMRQIYYGSQAWSLNRADQWDQIIPCGLDLPDPRPTLGQNLVTSLHESKVVAGVDIGHVFTGLESMVCPTPSVTPRAQIPHLPEVTPNIPAIVVRTTNEDLATWAGDLGSAAEQHVHDVTVGRLPPNWDRYFLMQDGLASSEDLKGDIDGFVIRAGLAGQSCAETRLQELPPLSSPISQILFDYYNATPASAGARRPDSARCFLAMIGAVFAGDRISNKTEVVDRIRPWVQSFTEATYMGRTNSPNIEPTQMNLLAQYVSEVCTLFVAWLESKL